MTRNNLRDQLSWLLRDVSTTLPAGPSLPSAPDSFDSQSEPSQTSAPRSQPQPLAVPANLTPATQSSAVTSGPPPAADADAVQLPRRLETPAAASAAEGGMARLTSAAKSRKPSLMVKEQLLPTPDSTSSIPPLQRAFSQLVDRKNARSAKKEPPATPVPAPAPATTIRSPVFSSDVFSNIDSIDLTSDDAPIKSSPRRDVRLWTEDCASRPEPLPRKSGKKRKSVEMSKVTPTPKKKQLVDDDDEFPDVHTLAELGSTRPKRGFTNALQSSQASPLKARAATASVFAASVIEEHTATKTISPKKTRVRRMDSFAAPAESSVVQETASTATAVASEASPKRPAPGGPVEDVARDGTHSTPGPSRKKTRKSRDSAVVQDSEDEFLTPPTAHVSFFSCMSGSQSHRESGQSTQRAQDLHLVSTEDLPVRTKTPSRKRTRKVSSPHQNGVENAEPEKPVAYSSDSDGSTLIMDLFLRNPAVIGRRRHEVQKEMKKLSGDYMRAINENWPRDRKDQVKEARNRLSEQQKMLDALNTEYEAHHALSERKNALVNKLVEAFENGMDAPEDEDAAAEINRQLQEKEQSLRHLLVAAGMNNIELFEEAAEPADPSSAPHHVVFGTQSPPHSAGSRPSRQTSMPNSTQADNTPQVIHQTQVPAKAPPLLSRRDEYGDCILAPQPPPFPREPRARSKQPAPRAPPMRSMGSGVAFSGGLLDDDDDDDDLMELCNEPPLPRRPQPQVPPPPARSAAGSKPGSRWGSEEVDYFSDDEDSMVQFAESLERESSSRPPPSTQSSRLVLLETSGNNRIVPRSRMEPARREKKVVSASKSSISRDLMKHPWSNDVRRALKDHFRMSGFRHNQLEAINATLSGKDAFVLMPTGGGKSLCYQLPAVIDTGKTRGITIVVSPLLSLMQDQIDHLKALHIVARQFSGEVDKAQRDMILEALRSSRNPENMVRLLYVTPEMIGKSQAFLNALDKVYSNNKLARIVIDEAHCVSQWGHDFRPDYKTLGEVRRRFPRVPVMALTATATPHVIVDIKHNLSIPECEIFSQSFNRPNLFYDIRTKGKNIVQTIADLIQSDHNGETGIVYTLSRKSAETIAKKLREQSGISAHHYHAKMETDEKTDVQRKWQSGQIKVVVATIAFGMGIDKPDVRFVVHHTLPKSLEGYYQETGRAGRDGGESRCYLYFGYGDITSLRKMINDGDGNQQQKDRQSQMLNRVVDFCEDKRDCRREGILRYFGEKFDPASCNKTCDNCLNGGKFELVDYTKTAIAALQVIQGRRQTTPKQCADILLGRGAPKDDERPEHYGSAKPLKEHVVLNILYRLTAEEALEEINKPIKGGMVATYCQMGPRAQEFLRGGRKLELVTKVGRGTADQDSEGLPKKRSKKSAASEQIRLPPSTNVSSPVLNARKKNSGRACLSVEEDEEESDAAPAGPIHANGYAKDGFVISSEADDDDYFEPMRPSIKGRQRTLNEMSRPAQGDRGSGVEPTDEIHGDFVEQFVQEAKLAEERIRNNNGLRKVLFTEQQLRLMAVRWTTSLSKMCLITGIGQDNVKKYGGQLLPILLKYHNFYRNAMGISGAGENDDFVDLVSDGDDDGGDYGRNSLQQQPQAQAPSAQARRSTKGKKPAQESFFSDEAEEDNDDQDDSFELSRYFNGEQRGPETAAEREGREWNERFDQAGEAAGARAKSSQSRSRNGSGSGAGGGGGRASGSWKGGKKSYARRASGGGVAKRKALGKKAGATSKGGSASTAGRARASGSGSFGLMPL